MGCIVAGGVLFVFTEYPLTGVALIVLAYAVVLAPLWFGLD